MMQALFWGSIGFAVAMLAAVVVERAVVGVSRLRWARLEHRYTPLLRRALAGDEDTMKQLANCRHGIACDPGICSSDRSSTIAIRRGSPRRGAWHGRSSSCRTSNATGPEPPVAPARPDCAGSG